MQAQEDRRTNAIITGGSAGIGLALAREFAAHGHDLVLVARHADRLRTAADEIEIRFRRRCLTVSADLTRPGASDLVLEALQRAAMRGDILVNCAAMGLSGAIASGDRPAARALLTANVQAATEMIHALLPGMVERGHGGILNVASIAGEMPLPYLAVYSASKSYLIALTQALAAEVRGSGVKICAVVPGPVHSAFLESGVGADASVVRFLPALQPQTVARVAYLGFTAGETIVTPGAANALMRFGIRVLPHALLARLMTPSARSLFARRRG